MEPRAVRLLRTHREVLQREQEELYAKRTALKAKQEHLLKRMEIRGSQSVQLSRLRATRIQRQLRLLQESQSAAQQRNENLLHNTAKVHESIHQWLVRPPTQTDRKTYRKVIDKQMPVFQKQLQKQKVKQMQDIEAEIVRVEQRRKAEAEAFRNYLGLTQAVAEREKVLAQALEQERKEAVHREQARHRLEQTEKEVVAKEPVITDAQRKAWEEERKEKWRQLEEQEKEVESKKGEEVKEPKVEVETKEPEKKEPESEMKLPKEVTFREPETIELPGTLGVLDESDGEVVPESREALRARWIREDAQALAEADQEEKEALDEERQRGLSRRQRAIAAGQRADARRRKAAQRDMERQRIIEGWKLYDRLHGKPAITYGPSTLVEEEEEEEVVRKEPWKKNDKEMMYRTRLLRALMEEIERGGEDEWEELFQGRSSAPLRSNVRDVAEIAAKGTVQDGGLDLYGVAACSDVLVDLVSTVPQGLFTVSFVQSLTSTSDYSALNALDSGRQAFAKALIQHGSNLVKIKAVTPALFATKVILRGMEREESERILKDYVIRLLQPVSVKKNSPVAAPTTTTSIPFSKMVGEDPLDPPVVPVQKTTAPAKVVQDKASLTAAGRANRLSKLVTVDEVDDSDLQLGGQSESSSDESDFQFG